MEYLVFNTEDAASAAERAIFDFGAALAGAAGYAVGDGVIHGKKYGETNLKGRGTRYWSKPPQRQDNK